MGSKTIQGIRFNVYPNDHDPPHVDAEIDGMKMKIFFGSGTKPPEIGPTNPRIKRNDANRAFRIFLDNEDALKTLYKEVHGKAVK
jgi:hypothetical protein